MFCVAIYFDDLVVLNSGYTFDSSGDVFLKILLSSPAPGQLNQNLWGQGSSISIVTKLPDDFNVQSGLSKSGLERELF